MEDPCESDSYDKEEDNVTMLEKLEENGPYNIFFTIIAKSPSTSKEKNAIKFTDLLCPSLGILKKSLQINFLLDMTWLMKQYKTMNLQDKPLTVLYGLGSKKLVDEPNVKTHFVEVDDKIGCHHSKIGIFVYEDDSLRVVISSANLYFEDWNKYNNGVWISPLCKRLPDSSSITDGESPTGFKSDILRYLSYYDLPIVNEWIKHVERADFSEFRVFFVSSVPGLHSPNDKDLHFSRVADLLKRHVEIPQGEAPDWTIIAQFSSLGWMGKGPEEWLRPRFLRALSNHKGAIFPRSLKARLCLVYPTERNVSESYEGLAAAGCLNYLEEIHKKQPWLHSYLYQWKADRLNRTRAMPHFKSYCRVSPCRTKLSYFLLTSANTSRSAWGVVPDRYSGDVYSRSWEAGVLFLPRLFGEDFFEIAEVAENKNGRMFPFMFDLPLAPYEADDEPWHNEADNAQEFYDQEDLDS